MSISKIEEDLKGHDKDFPPVHLWNPELCEGQEFHIDRNGNWLYNDSPIKNYKLTKLFSTVLRKDLDGYFLVTPHEKVPVKVDLAPYKIIDYKILKNSICLSTNFDYDFILNKTNTTKLIEHNNILVPIVHVRDSIDGFFDRNIYYNLINFALENKFVDNDLLYLPSETSNHIIGKIA